MVVKIKKSTPELVSSKWADKLRTCVDVKGAALALAEGCQELTNSKYGLICLLDISMNNLVFYGVNQDLYIDEQPKISLGDYQDPLSLCLIKDEPITYICNGVDNPASLKALNVFYNKEYLKLWMKPLKAPGGNLIGALMLIEPKFNESTNKYFELFCDYGSSVIFLALKASGYKRQTKTMLDELTRLEEKNKILDPSLGLIGQSEKMQNLRQLIIKAAYNGATVLLTGETGTGKELAALAIHQNSQRSDKVFVKIDCASIPPHLLESEFFGYSKGAFTGADKNWSGLLRSANGGTVLLDEIGEMPIELQAKLLRVLQEREVRPVGDVCSHKIDITVIAATNRNLKEEIEKGLFRLDLYHRLAIFPISLPPLRERREDIPLLINHFLELFRKKYKRPDLGITPQAVGYLYDQNYEGNVRELSSIIERAVLMSSENILDLSLFTANSSVSEALSLPQRIKAYEDKIIEETLKAHDGNRNIAAKILKIPRRTLDHKIQKNNLQFKTTKDANGGLDALLN